MSRRRGGTGEPRAGTVLGVVVLLVLALELLAHGALLLAVQERSASRAGLSLLQAQAAADVGVARVQASAFDDSVAATSLFRALPLGAGGAAPHHVSWSVRRLGREVWMAEAEGRAAGATWSWRRGRPLWVLDPVSRVAAEPGAVVLPTWGAVRGGGALAAPVFRRGSAPSWCHPWAAALDSLLPPGGMSPVLRVPSGAVQWPGLGRLGVEELAAVLEPVPGPEGTPAPREAGGTCVSDPWNWGDPVDPAGACRERKVGGAARGDLVVAGGVGQGLLVVAGSLRMLGTRFRGVVVAGGSVSLEGGATVEGQVRAGGHVTLAEGTSVVADPCRAAEALYASRALLRSPRRMEEIGPLEGW